MAKSKSEKMYSKSPSIGKDEEGKPSIKKPTEADGEDMGIESNSLPEDSDNGTMPIDIIQREKDDVAKRHIEEHKQMTERHHDEFKSMIKRHSQVKENLNDK